MRLWNSFSNSVWSGKPIKCVLSQSASRNHALLITKSAPWLRKNALCLSQSALSNFALHVITPVTLPAKQIVQDLWRMKRAWDQPSRVNSTKDGCGGKSESFRCYFSRSDHERVTLQLHHFYNASKVGYGTATNNASAIVPKANPRIHRKGLLHWACKHLPY